MIEINLLPRELKRKSAMFKRGPWSFKQAFYIIPVILSALLVLHLSLAIDMIFKSAEMNLLNNKWKALEPERQVLGSLRKEQGLFSLDSGLLEQFARNRVSWSQKLNALSLQLPSGVWFTELVLVNKELVFKGSAVSAEKQEVNLINKFMDNLRQDGAFFKDFKGMEVTSVERKQLGGWDIVDFVITAGLK